MRRLPGLVARIRRQNVTPGLVGIYLRKLMHQAFATRPQEHGVLGILGCQRSGTSVMSRVFFRDREVRVFREKSKLTGGEEGLRYLPFAEINRTLATQRSPLIVFKMLVESQRALEFLETVQGARVLWLFRHYRDVVNSNLNRFGLRNGIDDLRGMLSGNPGNWRSEACSDKTRHLVGDYFSESMRPQDAAALFWYARNQLFFEQHLYREKRALLVEYERFVQNPAATMRSIYAFCGRAYPGDKLVAEVASGSVSKGKHIELSADIEALCIGLLDRLQQAASAQVKRR